MNNEFYLHSSIPIIYFLSIIILVDYYSSLYVFHSWLRLP